MTKLPQLSRFKVLDTAVKRCLVEAGAALLEIRDKELFKDGGHKSFKDYAESIGRNYHWAWRQISASQVAKELPAITSVATAKAISKVPLPKRPAVINRASKATGGKISVPAIQKAANPVQKVPAKVKGGPKDGTGLAIPPEVQAFWDRNEEARSLLSMISKVRTTLEKGQDDLLFKFVDTNMIRSKLSMVYEELQCAVSYAVCPECNGVIFKDCEQCRKRGTMPEFYWNMVDEKIRKLRE